MSYSETGEFKRGPSTDFQMTIPEENSTNPTTKNREESREKETFVRSVCMYLTDFMENSTIHGFRYLVGNELSFIEKLFWFLVLAASIYTCTVLIGLTWTKWEQNPVFIAFAQSPVRMWDIPFPAVTICSRFKYNLESQHVFRYFDKKIRSEQIGNVSDFCTHLGSARAIFDGNSTEEATDFMAKAGFSRKDLFRWRCTWSPLTLFGTCENLFLPILTELGQCFSFNMLDKKDLLTHLPKNYEKQQNISHWTYDKNYAKANHSGFPFRATAAANYMMFFLKVGIRGCDGNTGFKIMLHHPATVPTLSSRAIDIDVTDPYDEYMLWIRPEITVASGDLKSYSPQRRKCMYSNEGHLKFYKIYTEENCKMECLATNTLQRCGCVTFEMPHDEKTKICTLGDRCPKFLKNYIDHVESGIDGIDLPYIVCNCLPSCNSITYNADVVKSNRDTSPRTKLGIKLKFRDKEFVSLERQEIFGDVNFWAGIGGFVGLCTGFSILSLAEIVYYLFLRWMCKVGRRFCRWRLT